MVGEPERTVGGENVSNITPFFSFTHSFAYHNTTIIVNKIDGFRLKAFKCLQKFFIFKTWCDGGGGVDGGVERLETVECR